MTHANGRITSPAKNSSASVAASAVACVSTERGSVSFTERLSVSYSGSRRFLRRFSRTRSKMMIVSLSEYPITVSSAATTVSEISRCISLMNAIVVRMSCIVAMVAATPKRHSNRNREVHQRDEERDENRDDRAAPELAADLRADGLGADDLERVLRRTLGERFRSCATSIGAAGVPSRTLRLDREVAGRAERRDFRVLDAAGVERGTHLGGVGRLDELELHQRAARELDAVVEAAAQRERAEPDHDEGDREPGGPAPPADEIDFGVVQDAQHQMLSVWAPRGYG